MEGKTHRNIFHYCSGGWRDKLSPKNILVILFVFGRTNLLPRKGDNWSGVWKEKLTEKDLTIVVVVVVVGGTNSRPKIDVISICLWKDKCFAQRIDNCLTRKS